MANTGKADAGEINIFGDAMGMESVNFRFSVDAKSKIFNFRWIQDLRFSMCRKSIAGMSLAGMSLLVCNVYSAGCFIGGMCCSLLNVW